MSSKQGTLLLSDLSLLSNPNSSSAVDPRKLKFLSLSVGGKAKPLKQPKVDKKEYDEVFCLIRRILDCFLLDLVCLSWDF